MAEPKPVRQRTLQLEYRFDRLLPAKLTQIYQMLVPDKRWSTGEEHLEAARRASEVMHEQARGHLRSSLL